MKKYTVLLLLAALLLSLGACGKQSTVPADTSAAAADAGTSDSEIAGYAFTDDLGREVIVQSHDRVAVMIGSFADIWCIAGGHDSIVAAANDSWTSFDLDLGENVTNLGAIKTPDTEALLASEPDLVIASTNTQADVDLLETFEQAGITAVYFDVQNFNDYLRVLKACTDITGCTENYTLYGTDLAAAIEAACARQDGSSPSVLCVRATGSSVVIKGSQDYLLGEMLADLGCVNIADSDTSLLENLSLEAIMTADPDYIFAVLQGSDPTDAQAQLDQALLSNPAWASLTAVQNGRFIILENSLYNLKPNARWGEAYEKLADILYPAE